ncbi:MAG TPA: hypothetical protein VHZ03_44420 [Trebonia sp.]|nr:hypothetical protein [Trebonia sp.]
MTTASLYGITASAATVIVALLTLLLASFGLYHDLGLHALTR